MDEEDKKLLQFVIASPEGVVTDDDIADSISPGHRERARKLAGQRYLNQTSYKGYTAFTILPKGEQSSGLVGGALSTV